MGVGVGMGVGMGVGVGVGDDAPGAAVLLIQIAVILAAARAVGWGFRRLHQPQVVGEMVAGILLGPSLLGWAAPGVSAALFPPESLAYLNVLSQVGLVLFMFLVGLEFDPRLLKGRGHTAVVTSHVSIVAPFLLGTLLALYLYPRLSDASVTFTGFALFLGAAMSVTAFPVLARILAERNLLGTRVGAVTIACAAVDDVTAWSILAVVVAIVRAAAVETPLWLTVLGTVAYTAAMLVIVRRLLRWVETYYTRRGRLTQDLFAGLLVLLALSAWITESLGIHALFGAFLLGGVMPKERDLVHDLTARLEDVTVTFLLPIFFAITGLRVSLGIVRGGEMWFFFALILLVAVAGKFGGSALAARATGLGWREAAALGVLMNTRGLMELVILGIGFDLGVISPALFTMMAMMAVITTFMTTPLLELVYPTRRIREEAIGGVGEESEHTIVIPISLPSAGPGLLDVAAAVARRDQVQRIYALHLGRSSEGSLTRLGGGFAAAEDETLGPVLNHARERGIAVRPLSLVTHDVARDIVEVAHAKTADLVLMGWHKPLLGQSVLGGTVQRVMHDARADVAVYLERRSGPWKRVLVPFLGGPHDRAALELARRLRQSQRVQVTILHVVTPERARREPTRTPSLLKDASAREWVRLAMVESDDPVGAAIEEAAKGYDLIVVAAAPTWGLTPSPFGMEHERLVRGSECSMLIVRAAPGAQT